MLDLLQKVVKNTTKWSKYSIFLGHLLGGPLFYQHHRELHIGQNNLWPFCNLIVLRGYTYNAQVNISWQTMLLSF